MKGLGRKLFNPSTGSCETLGGLDVLRSDEIFRNS
jgi:hypothetical protein